MNPSKEEIVFFRIAKSDEAFDLAKMAMEKGYFNSAVSELYYACFYLVSALLVKHDLTASTHAGVKSMFGFKFINEGFVDKKWQSFTPHFLTGGRKAITAIFLKLEETETQSLYNEVAKFRDVMKPILKEQ